MYLDGVSIKGSCHEVNQDSYEVRILDRGFVAALSDGLGSKKLSHYGSRALCDSAAEIAAEVGEALSDIAVDEYITKVYARWTEKLIHYDITDCYATMLVFVLYAGRAAAVRLGDGFIGIWADGQVRVLFDRKEDYFANETDCLTQELLKDRFEVCDIDVSMLHGVVICSDGVGVGNMLEAELSAFTREFIEGYCDMQRAEIREDITSWLEDWPGADDKTLVYCIAERE